MPGSESAVHAAPCHSSEQEFVGCSASEQVAVGVAAVAFPLGGGGSAVSLVTRPWWVPGGGRRPRIQLRLEPQPTPSSCYSVLGAGTKSRLQCGLIWHLGRGLGGVSLAHSEWLNPPALCVCVWWWWEEAGVGGGGRQREEVANLSDTFLTFKLHEIFRSVKIVLEFHSLGINGFEYLKWIRFKKI